MPDVPPRRTAPALAALFTLYGLIATALLGCLMPPFQNADEIAHYLRAAQIADGRLLGSRHTVPDDHGVARTTAGGRSDPAVATAAAAFNDLITDPAARDRSARHVPPVYWSKVRPFLEFANTALYPPVFYLPAALGVAVGRHLHLSVIASLVVSRLATGICAVTLGAVAIAFADGGAVWLFAVLTLPMSLSLMASSSQDGLMLAASALAGCQFLRLTRPDRGHATSGVAVLGLALGAIAMARPPYAALALLPLALRHLPWRSRLLGAAIPACLGVGWSLVVLATSMTNVGAFLGADPAAQMAYLLHQPWQIAAIAFRTFALRGPSLAAEFVGVLGWLSVVLPRGYYPAAWSVLALAAFATCLGKRGAAPAMSALWYRHALVPAGLLLAIGGMCAIQYLTWTVPGHPLVEGLQGRYFLPLALAGIGVLPGLPPRWQSDRLRLALIAVVAAFPIVSVAVAVQAVVMRYYLT